MIFSSLLACASALPDGPTLTASAVPSCGDGVVQGAELCDDGGGNADDVSGACRTSCTPASCGDGVADPGESCDDGNAWGGDGCRPDCLDEPGQLEGEPNDSPDTATPWGGWWVHGALPSADVDCVRLDLPECASVGASLVGPCTGPASLSLADPSGAVVAVGTPDASGCAVLDPARATGARFTAAGAWTLCLSSPSAVPAWTVQPEVLEGAPWPLSAAEDPDGDGLPAPCDEDRDGDGVLDAEDTCPDVPNGPNAIPLAPSPDGFLRAWLSAGPFDGTTSTEGCRASEDDLLEPSEAEATPRLGDLAGANPWRVLWSSGDRVGFLGVYDSVAAPREVYVAVYLRSATPRRVTLALGPDDGARAWLDGAEVLDITGCQGTAIDQFQVEVDLTASWQRLLVKVRDHGGDWGVYARFLEGGVAVTDLELSLDPDGPWLPDQRDSDGDGLGDVCDPEP